MSRRHTVACAVIAGVALVGSAVALAQGPPGPLGRRGGDGLALGRLNLTDAQQQQVRDLRERYQTDLRAAADRVRTARTAERTAVEALPIDENQIRAAMQTLGEAQTELTLVQARLRADVFAVLTPDQQAEAQKLRDGRRGRLEERRQRVLRRLDQRRQQQG